MRDGCSAGEARRASSPAFQDADKCDTAPPLNCGFACEAGVSAGACPEAQPLELLAPVGFDLRAQRGREPLELGAGAEFVGERVVVNRLPGAALAELDAAQPRSDRPEYGS